MRGFTLIELTMVIIISVLVGTFLVGILVNNTSFFYKQSSIVSGGLSLNDTLEKIGDYVSQAAGISASYPATSPTYTTSSETLILKVPAIITSGTADNIYDFVVIAKDGSKPNILNLEVFPDPQSTRVAGRQVLITALDKVEFIYLDNSDNPTPISSITKVKTTLEIVPKTASVGSKSSSTIITSLKNI